jgi:hypothetical protein
MKKWVKGSVLPFNKAWQSGVYISLLNSNSPTVCRDTCACAHLHCLRGQQMFGINNHLIYIEINSAIKTL